MIDLDVNLNSNIYFEWIPNFQNITFPNKCIIPLRSFFICYDQSLQPLILFEKPVWGALLIAVEIFGSKGSPCL